MFGRETRSYSQRMYLISAHALEDAPVRQGCRSGCATELRLEAAQNSRFGLRLAEGSCSSFFVSADLFLAFRCFSAASRRTKLCALLAASLDMLGEPTGRSIIAVGIKAYTCGSQAQRFPFKNSDIIHGAQSCHNAIKMPTSSLPPHPDSTDELGQPPDRGLSVVFNSCGIIPR